VNENGDRLLDATEAAELLHVKVSWVREATRDGRLPCVPLGRYRRYRRERLLEWIAQRERGA
jgi:excisionase family DNA binding protein